MVQKIKRTIMKGFREFIDESIKLGSLTIFDIDDTLFHTTAKVMVMKNGKIIRKLSNSEYNFYNLKQGESFDYSEFKDSNIFYNESIPIKSMLNKARAIITNSSKNPLSKVIAITARANFDDKQKFLATFRKYGIDIDRFRVERAGNISDISSIAIKKAIITRSYLLTGNYSTVRLFDDSKENLREFLHLSSEFPEVKFEAYFVTPNGTVKKI